MDGPELSRQERMILEDMEARLRTDPVLDRRLRTLRRGIRPWTGSLSDGLVLCACLLSLASVAAFLRAATSTSPAGIVTFAVLWVPTAACLLGLLCRWSRATLAGRAGRRKDGP
ncbi:DUF3040 domain-containing protein [Streptomyces sp. NPDC085524]|uniref:DUF3040 domain-containing protein n=1 Tax=unclassified Streptomyces TaxID=2593676 RepID=UPI0036CFD72E